MKKKGPGSEARSQGRRTHKVGTSVALEENLRASHNIFQKGGGRKSPILAEKRVSIDRGTAIKKKKIQERDVEDAHKMNRIWLWKGKGERGNRYSLKRGQTRKSRKNQPERLRGDKERGEQDEEEGRGSGRWGVIRKEGQRVITAIGLWRERKLFEEESGRKLNIGNRWQGQRTRAINHVRKKCYKFHKRISRERRKRTEQWSLIPQFKRKSGQDRIQELDEKKGWECVQEVQEVTMLFNSKERIGRERRGFHIFVCSPSTKGEKKTRIKVEDGNNGGGNLED